MSSPRSEPVIQQLHRELKKIENQLGMEIRSAIGTKGRGGESYDCMYHIKGKIATTTIIKHFDSDRTPAVVVYASKWAVSASFLQEYDGVY